MIELTTKQKLLIIAVIVVVIGIVVIIVSTKKTPTQDQSIPVGSVPEDITAIEYSMEKTGEINITSGTIGAQTTVASLENSFTATQSLPAKIKVPVGKFAVQIFAKGFANFEKDIEISADQTVKIDATLVKLENDISEGAPI